MKGKKKRIDGSFTSPVPNGKKKQKKSFTKNNFTQKRFRCPFALSHFPSERGGTQKCVHLDARRKFCRKLFLYKKKKQHHPKNFFFLSSERTPHNTKQKRNLSPWVQTYGFPSHTKKKNALFLLNFLLPLSDFLLCVLLMLHHLSLDESIYTTPDSTKEKKCSHLCIFCVLLPENTVENICKGRL